MGTQQILLIVLSVIIVGVAIAVGISMFNSQSYNSNKTAIASDAQSFAAQVIQYYKTPTSQGGAGGVLTTGTEATMAGFLGFNTTTFDTTNDNGTYVLAIVDASTVTITGTGTAENGAGQNPQIVATITLPAGTIASVASDV